MKKSTIFLVLLVYIASFIVVGLLGIQVRAHNEIIYVEDIKLAPVNPDAFIVNEYSEEKERYEFWTYYEEGMILQFKASVYPANVTNSAVKVTCGSTVADVYVTDNCFVNVVLKEEDTVTINFDVISTDGMDFKVSASLIVIDL